MDQGSVQIESQPAGKASVSSKMMLSGYILASLIVVLFLILYSLSTYQLDFWEHYFFYDSKNLGQYCTVQVETSDNIEVDDVLFATKKAHSIEVPHAADALGKLVSGTGKYIHAKYTCAVPRENLDVSPQEASYVHMGWSLSDRTQLRVNGKLISDFSGYDKLSFPLSASEINKNGLNFEISISSSNRNLAGLSGKAPLVYTSGNAKNNKIFGIESSLQQTRQLYNVLPVLTLGLFLVLAWFGGLRSQILLITACFVLAVLARNLVILWSEFWPWGVITSYRLSTIMQGGIIAYFFIFALELLNCGTKWIPRLMWLPVLVILAEIGSMFIIPTTLSRFMSFEHIHYVVNMVGCLWLIHLERRKRTTFSLSRQRINQAFVWIAFAFAILGSFDFAFTYFNIPIRLSYKIDLIMPLFIGGVVFYTLALIEQEYREEKAARAVIERDLELAKHIQDSLSSPEEVSVYGRIRVNFFQKKHQKVAGDWLTLRELPSGELVIVVTDATGKGMQAALVIHAVQSLWAEELDNPNFSPEQWLLKVQRTLKHLGKRQVHSLTAGILILTEQRLVYWSAGHLPVFVAEQNDAGTKVKALTARGGVLGASDELRLEPSYCEINPDFDTVVLLGSDGVFPNGTRTKPNEVKSLLAKINEGSTKFIESMEADDDRTLVACTLPKND